MYLTDQGALKNQPQHQNQTSVFALSPNFISFVCCIPTQVDDQKYCTL